MEVKTDGPARYSFSNYERSFSSRTCRKADRSLILDVYQQTIFKQVKEYYEVDLDMFHKRFDSDFSEIEIIEENGNPIGFYQMVEKAESVHLLRLFLHPKVQKRGIGEKLINSVILWAEQNGKKEILLSVWENNPALTFYKKYGFGIMEKQNHKYLMSRKLDK
ncbi:MAG: GNAT family N-acetyltransferase [Spirochaetales bacterium]|nr:GNAT family N-acetyltransferase [Spirochaetales bacterium]